MQEEIHKKIQSTEKEMRELSLSVERLHQEYQQLLNELELTPEQIKASIENPENLLPEERELIQEERKKLDEKLNLELSQIKDIKKTEENFETLKEIQKHWLFVR